MALSVEDLRAFTLVVKERSVSGAAAGLGVTQQSVSERIRRLERRLGVELFDRRPHGMEPTPASFRLLPLAQQSVVLMDRAMSVAYDDDLIRACVHGATAEAVLPLLDMALSGSRLEVTVQPDAPGIITAVSSGLLDVGFGSFTSPSAEATTPAEGDPAEGGPGLSPAPAEVVAEVVVEQLFTDPVIWVAPPDHPLAVSGTGPAPSDLAVLAVGASGGPGANPSAGEGDPVGGTDGLRIAPLSSVARALREGRLVEVPVQLPGWVLPVSMAYRATEAQRPVIVALRSAVIEEHEKAQARLPKARPPADH